MAKRRLTDQQRERIRSGQDRRKQRADRAGSDTSPPDTSLGTEQHGLIAGHFGSLVDVETWPVPLGATRPPRQSCHIRANLANDVVTGDRVVWREGQAGTGVVEARLERTSLLTRPDMRGVLKPVAANIDVMVLVITPEPTPSAALIDRYLVAAELQDIPLVLLLNKTDLLNADNTALIEGLLEHYQRIGYPVHRCSARNGEGMNELHTMLKARFAVFVGQSGTGKSSLVNVLLPHVDTRVGEISTSSKLGRHTTTNAELFHFAEGGAIIDSPGIREFGLWHLDPALVERGFREFQPLLGQCRFSDCKHKSEPGCALKAAVAEGSISAERFDSYFTLLQQIAMGYGG